MYNEYDDMYEEHDIDVDVAQRKELLAQAKAIDVSGDMAEVNRAFGDLRRQWKKIYYWESAYEDELEAEFDAVLDVFYAKQKAGYASNQEAKEALITQAQELVKAQNLNEATKNMGDLMTQWKMIGSSGKAIDDTLWESFQKARQAFFDRKHQNWEEQKEKQKNAYTVKQSLIEQALTLASSEDWAKTSDDFKDLMNQWKAVGSAGKDSEDELWSAFNTHRQSFYERRESHYGQMRDEQDQKYEQKRALVEQAKAIATSKEYTREHTTTMKDLTTAWKSIGSCGKEREDTIWKEFRGIMDNYFNGLKEHNEARQSSWRQKMNDTRSRKLEMIQNQRRQIKYLQNEMVGLLGQRAIDETQAEIEDKEVFIKELEAAIADIDKTLNS